jgi:hypothetical protein
MGLSCPYTSLSLFGLTLVAFCGCSMQRDGIPKGTIQVDRGWCGGGEGRELVCRRHQLQSAKLSSTLFASACEL